jgi:pyruvate formate lyase activating enzyme
MKKEALLWKKEREGVRCLLCPRLCLLKEGKFGYCSVRQNIEGKLYTLIYGEASSVALDPIEKKPLFHFYPRSQVLSFGTIGCNLHCIHCQNWQIAHAHPGECATQFISPEEAIKLALKYKADGIAWTYNEPTIWHEYTLETAKLCQREGLYTVYVTNGYITEEGLDMIAPYLDAYRVDIKGFNQDFYRKLAKVKDFASILKAAERAFHKWNLHLEVVTNVIPGWNDDEETFKKIASFIRDKLSPKTPWHITRFFPYLKLSHLSPTPLPTLEKAREIGLSEGLSFVYLGNVPGHPGENTSCPRCKKMVIERDGYLIKNYHVRGGKCLFCGEDLNIKD